MPPHSVAVQSSLQLQSPDLSTTWRGIGGAVVHDALATTVPTSSSTIWCRHSPAGSRQHQSGDPRVWTRQGCKTRAPAREPRKKQDSKSFALACAFLRPPVRPSVSCVGGSGFLCGLLSLSAFLRVLQCFPGVYFPWAPTPKPSFCEGNPLLLSYFWVARTVNHGDGTLLQISGIAFTLWGSRKSKLSLQRAHWTNCLIFSQPAGSIGGSILSSLGLP